MATDKFVFTVRLVGEEIGAVRATALQPWVLKELEGQARVLAAQALNLVDDETPDAARLRQLLNTPPDVPSGPERDILNYDMARREIQHWVADGRLDLDVAALEWIHAMVVDGVAVEPEGLLGRLRTTQVDLPEQHESSAIDYIAPDGSAVLGLVADLMAFVNSGLGWIDPIVLAGVFHRQCKLIHPFDVGSGRVTRLMTSAILARGGLDAMEIFAFETQSTPRIPGYERAVGLLGDYAALAPAIDYSDWLEVFVDGLLVELQRVRQSIKALEPSRLEDHHRKVIDFLGKNGSINQTEYGSLTDRSLASRKNDLKRLVELELIAPRGGGRGTYYVLTR
jgi:Fic family protein